MYNMRRWVSPWLPIASDSWKKDLASKEEVNESKHCANRAPVIDGVAGDPQVAELRSTKFKNC